MKLHELTAHELSGLLKNKKISAVELTQLLLDRIKKVEPSIGSYITILEEEALRHSKKIQDKIDRGEELSPLAGIPMAVKDNICTKGILTTCASKMLHNFIPPYNATVIEKLYQQDTILLGKLNMDEFAMGSSTETSYFKITRNPWDTERVPGGSSGGSAAAVAAGQAVFTLGSDTGGSIRQPASFCGVVGMKPTYGAVSRFGLIAFASSLDQIGPITKDVTDCALVLNAITGHDDKDSTSAPVSYPDYTQGLVNSVKGIKIGVPREYINGDTSHEVKKAVMNAMETFEKLGARCEIFPLPMTEYAIPAYYMISSAEASANLARYDGIKYGFRAKDYENLSDLYGNTRGEGFGTEVKRRILMGTFALSSDYYDSYYKKALQVRTMIHKGYNQAFDKYDILIGPAAPTTAFNIGEKINKPLEMYAGEIYTVSANIAGLPGMVIPCGQDSNKMPIGLQLIGKPFDEITLLRAAYTFEQNTEYHNRRPEF